MTDNIAQMRAHHGPNWSLWRRRMAACVGGLLLDDQREEA